MANHAPMMSALDTGVLRFKEDGTWKPLVVMGGFATVDSNQLSAPCQLERKKSKEIDSASLCFTLFDSAADLRCW